ncbi:methionyl-tRNA formyltransferase [Williamsia sp. CHRR-6]|uniref:methionyl-tRNA formyltransferase n=1 Tax=Williamsia sp. CHRR-6 TaxID=2835871 RepID=UPI001BD97EF9|nr:methionyl-tRNA formyltransferase [Williamsia sp. CHRR-6]MBT0568022.1 methionyl-tRNA formyltransferase [Williamsia sp. CHRR-6]
MRIAFAGTPEPAVPTLQRLLGAPDHDVIGVITRPDAVAGRGRTVTRSPVGRVADAAGLEVLTPERLADVRDRLAAWAPECVVVVAYGGLVPASMLDLPVHGWINLHFSLLPAWRGAAPVQAAIAAGDTFTGATTFRIEAGLDTGPTYGTLTERIRPTDTAGDLLDRLSSAGAELMVATLDGLDRGDLVAVPQPAEGVSVAPKVSTADARIRWEQPAHIVDRRVRAAIPAPGPWTRLGEQRLKIGVVTPVPDADALAAGAVRAGKREVLVGTGSTPVRLSTVQPPGKKAMIAADWARGAHLDDGVVLR